MGELSHATPQALLVLFSAHAYVDQVPTPTIVDNLQADGLIPSTAMVLIGNPSPQARGVELPPKRTVIRGSSYGGRAAAYAGLVNPQWFGHVPSLSGSYWWSPPNSLPGWLMRQYATTPSRDLRFYLDAGRCESARGGQDGILETNRHLGDVLRAKGHAVTQVEHDTGHDYLHWQGSLGCGLVTLLNPSRLAGLTARHGQAPATGELP